MIEEKDVGITEFVCKGNEIKATYKYRYSDFIVNEIQKDGTVIFPKKDEIEIKLPELEKEYDGNLENNSDELEEKLTDLLGIEKATDFLNFIEESSLGNDKIIFEIEASDKEFRTKIHEIINNYLQLFDSHTIERDGKKIIQIKFENKKKKKRNFGKDEKHLQCSLMKINLETFSALTYIGNYIRKRPSSFGIAGTKDKRGITTQRISVFKCSKEEMEKFSKINKNPAIKVFDFEYKSKQDKLALGYLLGNQFSICLRFIESPLEDLKENLNNLENFGFINYFGLQRFGNLNVHTHEIGREIIKRNFKNAFELIFNQDDLNEEVSKMKKEFLVDNDFGKILKKLPKKYKTERSLLEGLRSAGNNSYINSFMNLPRNLRELFPHAFQSYLWNKLASFRIKMYGLKPVEGDLVFDNIKEKNEKINKLEIENDFEISWKSKVKVLEKKDIESYSIFDVVLPIFGSGFILPKECFYQEFIWKLFSEEGISAENFEKTSKDFFLTGNYRFLIEKPVDLSWKLIGFDDKNQDLLTPFYDVEKDFDKEDGKFKALDLKFKLKKSIYATMMLREITKSSTSFSKQMALNQEVESY